MRAAAESASSRFCEDLVSKNEVEGNRGNTQNDFLASAHMCTMCIYVHEYTCTHIPHKTGWDGTRGRTAKVVLQCTYLNRHMYNRKRKEFGNPKSIQEEPCRMMLSQAVELPKAGRDLTPSSYLDLDQPGPRTMTKHISEISASKRQTFGHHIR